MRHYFFVLIFLLISCGVQSQECYDFSGVVVVDTSSPLLITTVTLTQLGKLVKKVVVENKEFLFKNLKKGKYNIEISATGYEAYHQAIVLKSNRSIKVKLIKIVTALDEVVVLASKAIVTTKNGDLKIDVANSRLSSLATPVDVLSSLPKVQLSPNRDAVTIVGGGTPLIYLGNQQISLSEFNMLAVDDIKTIELISTPSSKYEANGRSVILVKRKRSTVEGTRVTISEVASFKNRFNNYFSTNGVLKNKALEVKANIGYNQLGHWESNGSDFKLLKTDSELDYETKAIGDRFQLLAGLGVYYQINKNDYFSVNGNAKIHRDDIPIVTNSNFKELENQYSVVSLNKGEGIRDFVTANFNYYNQIGAKQTLFFGAQYASHKRDLEGSNYNGDTASNFDFVSYNDQKTRINSLAARLDYEYTVAKTYKLAMGTSMSLTSTISSSVVKDDMMVDTKQPDYEYSEKNYSYYAAVSKNVKNISFNVGIRIENTQIKGEVEKENKPLLDDESTIFYPKIKSTIKIDSANAITLSYAKTINRPNFSQANRLSVFLSPFIEFSNTIDLQPSIRQEWAINYQYKKVGIKLIHFSEKNPVYYNADYSTITNGVTMSPSNFESEHGYQLEITIPTAYKFWTATHHITAAMVDLKDKNSVVNNAKPYLYYYTDHKFVIDSKTTVGFNFWGYSTRNEGIYKRDALFVLGMNASRTLVKNLKASLQLNDVFGAMNFIESYTSNQIKAKTGYYIDAREVSFSLKYSFGNFKKPAFKNKNVDSNIKRIE